MKPIRVLNRIEALAVVSLALCQWQAAYALPIALGDVGNYAVIGTGGTTIIQSDFEIYQSATVINGNVAEGPYTTLTHGIDATVNGTWYYDTTDANPAASGYTGNVTGGFVQQNLSPLALHAISLSSQYAALVPTQTYSTLSEGQTINGVAGVNVIRVTGDVTLKTDLTINAPAGSSVVFQLTANDGGVALTLSGMTMHLTGGITAGDIVWNLDGFQSQKNDIAITSGSLVYGIFLDPLRNMIVDHGTVFGELIAGGDNNDPGLSIHSGSTVTQPPSNSVPDAGSTALLLSLGLGCTAWARRAFRI